MATSRSGFVVAVSVVGGRDRVGANPEADVDAIASGAHVGTVTFHTYTPALTGISSGAHIGVPALSAGRGTVSPSGIASTAHVGVPALSGGGGSISPAGIASTAHVGVPTLAPGAAHVTVAGIASTSHLGTLVSVRSVGGFFVGYSLVGARDRVGFAASSLALNGIASTVRFGGISHTGGAPGPTISPTAITSTARFGRVDVARGTPGTIGWATIGANTIGGSPVALLGHTGTVRFSVGASHVGTTDQVGWQPATQAVNVPTIWSTTRFGGIPQPVFVNAIASSTRFGHVSIVIGHPFAFGTTGITSSARFGALAFRMVVHVTGIATTAHVGQPTIAQGIDLHGLPPTSTVGHIRIAGVAGVWHGHESFTRWFAAHSTVAWGTAATSEKWHANHSELDTDSHHPSSAAWLVGASRG